MNQNSLDEAVTVMPVIDTRDVFKGAVCVISNDEDVHVITTDEVGGLRGLYAAFQLRYYVSPSRQPSVADVSTGGRKSLLVEAIYWMDDSRTQL